MTDIKNLIELGLAELREQSDHCLPEVAENRAPNSFLAKVQPLRLLRQTNDPSHQQRKSVPNVAPVKDDFVGQSNFIDSSDIIDQLEMVDYFIPKRRFPTDT